MPWGHYEAILPVEMKETVAAYRHMGQQQLLQERGRSHGADREGNAYGAKCLEWGTEKTKVGQRRAAVSQLPAASNHLRAAD